MDTVLELPKYEPPTIDEVMTNIEKQCSDDSSESTGAINLFKEIANPDPANKERQAKYAANAVYDDLMLTLEGIGVRSIEKSKSDHPRAQEYEAVARAIDYLVTACRALADDGVPLIRNNWLEQRQHEIGDRVYAYIAKNISLGKNKKYREIRVFIRPERYEESTKIRARKEKEITESAQPRMKIDVLPVDATQSAISIRVDQENVVRNFEITYDIQVGQEDVNLMDELDFSESDKSQVSTGQRYSHHFNSNLKDKDFNVTFADILYASNQKFAVLSARSGRFAPPSKPK